MASSSWNYNLKKSSMEKRGWFFVLLWRFFHVVSSIQHGEEKVCMRGSGAANECIFWDNVANPLFESFSYAASEALTPSVLASALPGVSLLVDTISTPHILESRHDRGTLNYRIVLCVCIGFLQTCINQIWIFTSGDRPLNVTIRKMWHSFEPASSAESVCNFHF